jgi:DNA polymerase alpha subunit A
MLKKILHQEDSEKIQEKPKEVPEKVQENVSQEPGPSSSKSPEKPKEIPTEPEVNQDDLNASIQHDFDDDFTIEPEKPKFVLKKPEPVKLTEKPMNLESTILKELEGIDFNEAYNMETPKSSGQVDLGKETMSFYYWDAWADPIKRPGEIFLFGKVEAPGSGKNSTEYKSICVHVENVDKCLYLLPRTHVSCFDIVKIGL